MCKTVWFVRVIPKWMSGDFGAAIVELAVIRGYLTGVTSSVQPARVGLMPETASSRHVMGASRRAHRRVASSDRRVATGERIIVTRDGRIATNARLIVSNERNTGVSDVCTASSTQFRAGQPP